MWTLPQVARLGLPALVVALPLWAWAGQAPSTRPSAPTARKLTYRPPLRGAPAARTGGGSRASQSDLPAVAVLAPDHVGLTTREQPSLFWYLSKPTDLKIEITLCKEGEADPALEISLPGAAKAGIQRVNLSGRAARLALDGQYHWVVALVADPSSRSRDILASGFIKRIAEPSGLGGQLAKAAAEEQAAILAEQGLWYDALAALSDRIDADPANRALRAERAALLQQVGMNEAAKADLAEK